MGPYINQEKLVNKILSIIPLALIACNGSPELYPTGNGKWRIYECTDPITHMDEVIRNTYSTHPTDRRCSGDSSTIRCNYFYQSNVTTVTGIAEVGVGFRGSKDYICNYTITPGYTR